MLLALSLSMMTISAARADVAPDPVVTTGLAAAAVGVLALVVFGAVLAVRYLRRPRD
jgi:hypothetical protein